MRMFTLTFALLTALLAVGFLPRMIIHLFFAEREFILLTPYSTIRVLRVGLLFNSN
jgi:hypothetical protein